MAHLGAKVALWADVRQDPGGRVFEDSIGRVVRVVAGYRNNVCGIANAVHATAQNIGNVFRRAVGGLMRDGTTTNRLRSSKAERLIRNQRGAGSIPVGASSSSGESVMADFGVDAPSVDFEHRPILFLPDGRALVRLAGF